MLSPAIRPPVTLLGLRVPHARFSSTNSVETPTETTLQSSQSVWTTTYWPMAGSLDKPDGDPTRNLWATSGPLDKFDQLLKAKGQSTGALEYERTPALNGLINKPSGHYIPAKTLRESDAERTTGVDFDGNGILEADVTHDFIDARGAFGKDGETDGTMSVGWWGSCDKVALAGVLFREPTKSVTIEGITFTPQDIKGLLTVIAESQSDGSELVGNRFDGHLTQILLKTGEILQGDLIRIKPADLREGTFRYWGNLLRIHEVGQDVTLKLEDGEEREIAASEIRLLQCEDPEDPSAQLFHTTVQQWLSEDRPFAMDVSQREQVWNYCYDKARFTESTNAPNSVVIEDLRGINGAPSGGTMRYVVAVLSGANSKTYNYWLEEKEGEIVNSGWLSAGPDFLWRPNNPTPAFTGFNSRNPFVEPALVKEIYEKSVSEEEQ